MKNFELILETIPPYPGLNIAIIEDNQDEVIQRLQSFSQEIDATLHVKALSGREEVKRDAFRVTKFSFDDTKYSSFSTLYDFVFMCANIDKREDKESLFKKIYRVMKNSGNLFICVDKGRQDGYIELLESINYVALNRIDLNDTIDVIVGKKMHGWKKV